MKNGWFSCESWAHVRSNDTLRTTLDLTFGHIQTRLPWLCSLFFVDCDYYFFSLLLFNLIRVTLFVCPSDVCWTLKKSVSEQHVSVCGCLIVLLHVCTPQILYFSFSSSWLSIFVASSFYLLFFANSKHEYFLHSIEFFCLDSLNSLSKSYVCKNGLFIKRLG